MIDVTLDGWFRSRRALVAAALVVAAATGCASKGGQAQAGAGATPVAQGGAVSSTPAKEPDRIVVQHVLIGFQGKVPGKNITRSEAEAKALAYDILARAKKGEDFDELVRSNTDDAFPGRYGMSNRGVTPAPGGAEYPRDGMVAAFGNVGFKLAVGEVGIADYDPQASPFGFHVIKRIQ